MLSCSVLSDRQLLRPFVLRDESSPYTRVLYSHTLLPHSAGLAVSEGGGGGDDNAPVFFTNTSGNMFLQPPAGSALAGDGAATGNFATLDSDMGGYPGSHQGGSGNLHHKSGEAKKVKIESFVFGRVFATRYSFPDAQWTV